MENISIESSIKSSSVWLCNSYYVKVKEHLVIMNNWKNDPEIIKKYPSVDREFTLFDALNDLLMKGGL